MKKLTISVTKRDIAEGVRMDCKRCPVARAIARRLVKSATVKVGGEISVGGLDVHFWDGKSSYTALPGSAISFVRRFDRGLLWNVKPFTFKLEIPERLVKR